MHNTENQIRSGITTLAEVSSKLGIAVTATAEYQAFKAAEQSYWNDPQAGELLEKFKEEERTLQLMQQLRTATTEDTERLEGLQRNIEANETLARYFDAQEKLVALLRELDEFISGKLKVDFAALTKPQRGCCG